MGDPQPQAIVLFDYDGDAVLYPEAIHVTSAAINAVIDWETETLVLFGRQVSVPRLIAYYGARGYRYSGRDHPARPLPPLLESLRQQVETLSGYPFNAVLANYYRNGRDSMGYHRDNEGAIDSRCIASVSFGATRLMRFRHRPSRSVIDQPLAHGALLLMHNCQTYWEHSLPKALRIQEPRINLTFRWLK